MIDGSITPMVADLGVERIDFESDDATDLVLITIDSDRDGADDRWLVAGGVRADFLAIPTGGSAEIIGNELRNLGNTAIGVDALVIVHHRAKVHLEARSGHCAHGA